MGLGYGHRCGPDGFGHGLGRAFGRHFGRWLAFFLQFSLVFCWNPSEAPPWESARTCSKGQAGGGEWAQWRICDPFFNLEMGDAASVNRLIFDICNSTSVVRGPWTETQTVPLLGVVIGDRHKSGKANFPGVYDSISAFQLYSRPYRGSVSSSVIFAGAQAHAELLYSSWKWDSKYKPPAGVLVVSTITGSAGWKLTPSFNISRHFSLCYNVTRGILRMSNTQQNPERVLRFISGFLSCVNASVKGDLPRHLGSTSQSLGFSLQEDLDIGDVGLIPEEQPQEHHHRKPEKQVPAPIAQGTPIDPSQPVPVTADNSTPPTPLPTDSSGITTPPPTSAPVKPTKQPSLLPTFDPTKEKAASSHTSAHHPSVSSPTHYPTVYVPPPSQQPTDFPTFPPTKEIATVEPTNAPTVAGAAGIVPIVPPPGQQPIAPNQNDDDDDDYHHAAWKRWLWICVPMLALIVVGSALFSAGWGQESAINWGVTVSRWRTEERPPPVHGIYEKSYLKDQNEPTGYAAFARETHSKRPQWRDMNYNRWKERQTQVSEAFGLGDDGFYYPNEDEDNSDSYVPIPNVASEITIGEKTSKALPAASSSL